MSLSVKGRTFTLYSRLKALPLATAAITSISDDAQDKKLARQQVSLENTSQTVGFLHAVLLKVANEHFLLAGPSGIGKTSYAGYLVTHQAAVILGQDWVAVEREGATFYASDLNFQESLRHADRCKLSGVIFLTGKGLGCDAYSPNETGLKALLAETFDTATTDEGTILSDFWLQSRQDLPFLCALPVRQKPEAYVAATLLDLLTRLAVRTEVIEVGVIGLGALGSQLAFQLGQLPFVKKVHLFNRTTVEATGYAIDMNQALITDGDEETFVAHNTPEAVFAAASVVFLTFREAIEAPVAAHAAPERWGKFYTHLPIIQSYARIASQTDFGGTIFVLTNPVDILSYAFYSHSQKQEHQLRTYQIYGVGLELDVRRAFTEGKRLNASLQRQTIKIYGNHADDLEITSPLPDQQTAAMHDYVKTISKEIRDYIPRTVYGPIGAIVKTLTAFIKGQSVHLTMVRDGAFIGQEVQFHQQLPQLPEALSGVHCQEALKGNRRIIAQYQDLL